jgi:MFS family permease
VLLAVGAAVTVGTLPVFLVGGLAVLAAAPSTLWLLARLALAGVPTALSQPAANELLMARVAPQRRGFAFAVKQSAIPVSTLLAGLAVPVVALTIGWRWAFLFAAVLGLLTVAAVPRMRWHRPTAPPRTSRAAPGSCCWRWPQ